MDTVLRMKAAALSPAFVEDLKQQVGQYADVEIHVRNAPDSAEWLSEEQFWALIGELDWSKEGDDAAVTEPLVAALAAMPVASIYRFQDLLSEKLWLLDTRAHAQVFLDEDDNDDGYLSVDDFLYSRCGVVANGWEAYEGVRQQPEKMPLDVSFEPLLFMASDAHERKTGERMAYQPAYNYETYSNRKGWNLPPKP